MTKPIAALVLALIVSLCSGCLFGYGAASPKSCHAKYIRDRKGDGYADTYDTCMMRAETRKERAEAHARGERLPDESGDYGTGGGFWAGAAIGAAVVANSQPTPVVVMPRPARKCIITSYGYQQCY